MKMKIFVGLFVAAFAIVASNVKAQDATVAAATESVPSQVCYECEPAFGFGGGLGLGSRLGGRSLGLNSQNSIRERMRAARAADHPIVEASPFANPSGSLQDWSRFRYYPYAYYPHNFSEKANMSVPKYQPGYQNFYPLPRRYHEGSHFILDVF